MKSQGKKLAQTAIQTGMQVAGDVVGGRSFKQSVGEHVPKAIKRTAGDLLRQSLVGNVGSKTVVKRPSGVRAKRAKKKKRPGDIFS
jgi:hypothetical protein